MESKNILKMVGNTPLVEIKAVNPHKDVRIFAKLEGFNPTGSIKDRIALKMIEDAEARGVLHKGSTIIEPTSGNTGIGLAMIASVKGYKMVVVMPETMSIERRKMLKAFGAELILVPKSEWRDAAISFAKKIKEGNGYFMPNQYENNANVMAHYEGTGKEIIEQMGKEKIDMFIAGIGTGGTLMGAGRRIREENPETKLIGVEPAIDSGIQGLKSFREGYIPKILNTDFPDDLVLVEDKKAFEMARRLIKEEGLSVGISSGAAMQIALEKAKELGKGNIVTVFPDSSEKYLSTELFNEKEG